MTHHGDAGRAELRAALRAGRWLLPMAAGFGTVVNLLMLTGPIYMLQVYDRVLVSRSTATLVALSGLMAALFLTMAVLDHVRGQLLVRLGARFAAALDGRVMAAALARERRAPGDPIATAAPRDLDAVQRVLASGALPALFDMVWVPLFAGGLFLFDPLLGWLGLAGAGGLVVLAALNQRVTKSAALGLASHAAAADALGQTLRSEVEAVHALGMLGPGLADWRRLRTSAQAAQVTLADRGLGFLSLSRAVRLLLQSAILGAGAYVVLQGRMSGGEMIAGSVLLGRALAPIEMAIAQWGLVLRAREAWHRLGLLLSAEPPAPPRLPLPRPAARLELRQVTVVPPGETRAVLRLLSLTLAPGQALAVLGPSGAGKTTLARVLAGAWPVSGGEMRLGGASPGLYPPDDYARWIGYLPQRPGLLPETVARNIARLAATPDPGAVIAAAQAAGVHEMILSLPQGYDTRLVPGGAPLSAGQAQRLALARALYGNPVLLVLDEPDAHLDQAGGDALNAAIRAAKARGAAVVVTAHRSTALAACDLALVLEAGRLRAFGPRDAVLASLATPGPQAVSGSGDAA
ncbi:MAG: type I secretion system permease/ATPase [Paracoccaceae bacterium]|nr:type I secretion system permease/ATPase [Paracoccaceae bacterium]